MMPIAHCSNLQKRQRKDSIILRILSFFCISQLQPRNESRTRNEDDGYIYIVGIPSVKRFLNCLNAEF